MQPRFQLTIISREISEEQKFVVKSICTFVFIFKTNEYRSTILKLYWHSSSCTVIVINAGVVASKVDTNGSTPVDVNRCQVFNYRVTNHKITGPNILTATLNHCDKSFNWSISRPNIIFRQIFTLSCRI